MIRSATAVWSGGPGAGEGSVTTSSGVINALYSFASGFNEEPCTSPGEMLVAAQASCVSLMFTQELAKAGIRPQRVTTHADLKVDEIDGLWTITDIHLDVSVEASPIDAEEFRRIAEAARSRCPITRVLNANITLNAALKPLPVHATV